MYVEKLFLEIHNLYIWRPECNILHFQYYPLLWSYGRIRKLTPCFVRCYGGGMRETCEVPCRDHSFYMGESSEFFQVPQFNLYREELGIFMSPTAYV